MLTELFGLPLVRSIPPGVWAGIVTGRYQIFGGVIRDAAGQIVRHLIPVAASPIAGILGLAKDAFTTYELGQVSSKLTRLSTEVEALSRTTASVLHVAQGTMALSGLNLALGAVSFVALNHKLAAVDKKLDALAKHVIGIRKFLAGNQRATMLAAVKDLSKIHAVQGDANRFAILQRARGDLCQLNLFYQQALAEADGLSTAMVYEDLFCVTALAQVRCSAELGMFNSAKDELEEMGDFWRTQARRVADTLIIQKDPERFLAGEFAREVPAARIAAWLDFVHDEEKGLGWVDELRAKSAPYYRPRVQLPRLNLGGRTLKQDQTELIPALDQLVTRHAVFEGYRSQYGFLEERKLKPSEYEAEIKKAGPEDLTEGFLILEGDHNSR